MINQLMIDTEVNEKRIFRKPQPVQTVVEGSDSEIEEEDLECDECGKVSENFDAYIEHRGK